MRLRSFTARAGLRWMPVAMLLAMLIATGCDRGGHPSQISKPAPDFSVTDGTDTVRLANYRGRVVLLNFWASWCAPCVQELPSLLDFHHRHPEIAIVAVSIDEDESAYRNFLVRRHVDFKTVRDPSEASANKYGTTGWPESFLIDPQGRIRRRFIGATDWDDPEIWRFIQTM